MPARLHPGAPVEAALSVPRAVRWSTLPALLLTLAHALQQLLRGVPLAALCVAAAALAGTVATAGWLWPRGGRAPRALRLGADGTIEVQTRDGCSQCVQLQPGSVRLGDWLLLHLKAPDGCSFRLLLGPWNIDPGSLATLHRRFRRPPTGAGLLL